MLEAEGVAEVKQMAAKGRWECQKGRNQVLNAGGVARVSLGREESARRDARLCHLKVPRRFVRSVTAMSRTWTLSGSAKSMPPVLDV